MEGSTNPKQRAEFGERRRGGRVQQRDTFAPGLEALDRGKGQQRNTVQDVQLHVGARRVLALLLSFVLHLPRGRDWV